MRRTWWPGRTRSSSRQSRLPETVDLLADESCDFAVVRALRQAGHDVTAISEIAPGIPDEGVAALADREDRVLVTEDRDFGRLVHAGPSRIAVIYLRFPAGARSRIGAAVVEVVEAVAGSGDRFAHRFVVVQPGSVRIID